MANFFHWKTLILQSCGNPSQWTTKVYHILERNSPNAHEGDHSLWGDSSLLNKPVCKMSSVSVNKIVANTKLKYFAGIYDHFSFLSFFAHRHRRKVYQLQGEINLFTELWEPSGQQRFTTFWKGILTVGILPREGQRGQTINDIHIFLEFISTQKSKTRSKKV